MRVITASLVILMLGLTPTASAEARRNAPVLEVGLTWSMPDRFGPDLDRDGLIDFPNTPAYVHNRVSGCDPCPQPRFTVRFEAALGQGLPVRSYSWRLTGSSLSAPLVFHSIQPQLEVMLPEGRYVAEVGAVLGLPWGSVSVRGREEVTVEDLLVVAIGDSYAAGEGNPEVRMLGSQAPAQWGDGGDATATRDHAVAHRSTVAWPARTALAVELADPHSSVTFVSVAASAARIDRGIISPQNDTTDSQLDQIARLVGERKIDVLLVQEGGNSVGFSRVVRALVEADPLFDPICYDLMVAQTLESVRDGKWGRSTGVRFALPFDWSCVPGDEPTGPFLPGLDGLAAAVNRLAIALDRFEVGRVVMVGYPDPTGADSIGTACREIVGDVTPPVRFHEISRDEGRLGVTEVLDPLNRVLASAAGTHGWTFVGGVDKAFAAGHGYCAPWPEYAYSDPTEGAPGFVASPLDFPDLWYRNPGALSGPAQLGGIGITWYRTASQSAVLQGPEKPFATTGTLHPNEVGHAVIARMVLAALGD